MKGLQQLSLGLCNTTRACAVLVTVTALLALGSSRATAQTGYDSLFIGHSFLQPVASLMTALGAGSILFRARLRDGADRETRFLGGSR